MRERVTAIVLFLVLGFYSLTIGWRGVELVRDGRPAAVLLGVGVILLPLVVVAAMVPLLSMARDGAKMMADLSSGREPGPQDEQWRGELEQAEVCRLQKDRKARWVFWVLLSFFSGFIARGVEAGWFPFMTQVQAGQLRFILVGIAIMLLVVFRPQGIFGNKKELAFVR